MHLGGNGHGLIEILTWLFQDGQCAELGTTQI